MDWGEKKYHYRNPYGFLVETVLYICLRSSKEDYTYIHRFHGYLLGLSERINSLPHFVIGILIFNCLGL